jgi:general secretion pathway protein H
MLLPVQIVRQCGFTLLEALVVLGVIVLALSVASVSFSAGAPERAARRASWDVASALRIAHARSVVGGMPVAFSIDVAKRVWRIVPGEASGALRSAVDVRVLAVASEAARASEGRIWFYPDGSSTGGRVTLSSGSVTYVVGVHWLTGAIEIAGP